MIGLGTLLNASTVVLGTAIGVGIGSRLPDRVRDVVIDGMGLLTVLLGVTMALKTQNFFIVMGSVLLGGLAGELLGIERRLERLGEYFQRRLAASSSTFSTGFVTASLLFCIGPMAILGPIQDGLRGSIQLLAVKSALDGVAALAFATTLGWGVGLSALSLLVYQGTITLLAGFVDRFLTAAMVTEMTAVGGVLILGIGLRILDVRQVRIGSFLPAVFFAPVLVAVVAAFN
jgi:uncharacterized membrane protein YqgA involved in biofilm formation